MFRVLTTALAGFIVLAASSSISTAQVPEYTPDQAISLLDRQIRTTLGFKDPGTSETNWLSLTYVGLEVPKDDEKLIDIIAVQCPPARNELVTYSTARRLDQVYELILKNASLSKPTVMITGLDAARAKIVDPDTGEGTQKYLKYRAHYRKWRDASRLFDEAKTRGDGQTALASLSADIQDIVTDWQNFGFKTEIEEALDKMNAADVNGNLLNTRWRQELLTFYRNVADGAQQGSTTNASIAIPRSTLHPSPDKWAGDAGWTKVSYAKSNEFSSSEENYRKQTRYGNAGGGFLFWRVGGSAHSTTETQTNREIKRASQIAFEFEIRRAIIHRPWLDQRFFMEPGFWTWVRPNNIPQGNPLPRVSAGAENGLPVDEPDAKYIDSMISIPLIPSEVVVGRKLKVTATVSDSDYDKIVNQSNSSANATGRAFFFFNVSGGGSNTSKLTKITSANGNTTFSLSFEGPVVIGFVSNVVPKTPVPKLDGRQWPPEAWGAQ